MMGTSPAAILCNGHSLLEHSRRGNLKKLPCETIGVNRSWELMQSSYHVMVDPLQWEMYARITKRPISTLPNLYTGMVGPESATRIPILDTEEPKFSWHPIDQGAWLCGAVTWVALQLAVFWKKNPIYFLGLDLQPRWVAGQLQGKFWGGTWDAVSAEARQRELFGYARGMLGYSGIELVNVAIRPEDTKLRALPRRTFEECFR